MAIGRRRPAAVRLERHALARFWMADQRGRRPAQLRSGGQRVAAAAPRCGLAVGL